MRAFGPGLVQPSPQLTWFIACFLALLQACQASSHHRRRVHHRPRRSDGLSGICMCSGSTLSDFLDRLPPHPYP